MSYSAADILAFDWEKRARGLAQARNAEKAITEIRAGLPVGEPYSKPNNALYNLLSNRQLNTGLGNLGEAAADVVLGKPSDILAVDMGLANVPVAGPASILAAGGMPGLVDVAGMGELRNAKKIPQYTYKFVKEFFGDEGLKNLDNALSMYPKAGKPSVNDAVYIMRNGIGGEAVPAIKPYRSTNTLEDLYNTTGLKRDANLTLEQDMAQYIEDVLENVKDEPYLIDKAITEIKRLNQALDNNDLQNAVVSQLFLDEINSRLANSASKEHFESELKRQHKLADEGKYLDIIYKGASKNSNSFEHNPELGETMRRMKELEASPVQNWDKLVTDQQRKDAKKAVQKPAETVVEPVVEPVEDLRPEWQKNGWISSEHPLTSPYSYEDFGRNMSEDSKRDLFVVDSLANHWTNQLRTGGLVNKHIGSPWERANARHKYTNYDDVSRGFTQNVLGVMNDKALMPSSAVKLRQQYKKNLPEPGKSTATLILNSMERPRYIDDINVFPDMAEGANLYEALFRRKVDAKLNTANPQYWQLRDWRKTVDY